MRSSVDRSPSATSHDVLYVAENLRGASDTDLFRLAYAEDRVVITDDLDFGYIGKIETLRPPAVVIARLEGFGREACVRRVIAALSEAGDEVRGHVVVIDPDKVRLRAFGTL